MCFVYRVREAEEFGRDANDAGLGGPRTAAGTRPGTKALERQVHELQGEVDTLRNQLKDAKARIIAETGPISEQPAAGRSPVDCARVACPSVA